MTFLPRERQLEELLRVKFAGTVRGRIPLRRPGYSFEDWLKEELEYYGLSHAPPPWAHKYPGWEACVEHWKEQLRVVSEARTKKFETLLRELDRLDRLGESDGPRADAIREEMEPLWQSMNSEEQSAMRTLSAKLNLEIETA